jgi:DNA-binding transcriptional MerR regulator
MYSSFTPPRQVTIGGAAAFVGTTPRAIRHYHQIGLLPEPERGSDDRRRYGYEEMIRLLWIRRMADAGVALDDIRDAFADAAGTADSDGDVSRILERLEESLVARQAELEQQRTAVQRMRAQGSRLGLLSDLVSDRLADLPEGALRQDDLDTLLVTERIFGELGASVQASRFIALATHPQLREDSDRLDAAEEALDDTVAVDDPRVAEIAAERHAFEVALRTVIEDSGLAQTDDDRFDAWDESHPLPDDEDGADSTCGSTSLTEAVRMMPYDFSRARLRCMELVLELDALDVEQPGVQAMLATEINAVDIDADTLFARRLVGVERNDAADADRQRGLARFERRNTQAGDRAVGEVVQALDVAVLDLLAVDDADGHRRLLQIGLTLGCGHDDFVESLHPFDCGCVRRRCGLCRRRSRRRMGGGCHNGRQCASQQESQADA